MRISTRSVMVAAALAAATIASSPVFAGSAENVSQRRHVVEIQKLKFVPAELEVSPGDIIVWINQDIAPHTVTAKDKSWGSKTLKRKDEWQTVVSTDMPGAYYCRFHPNMKAMLKVVQ